MAKKLVYRDFDQETLDHEYDARGTVDDADVFINAYADRSEEARKAVPCRLDVPFGEHPDEIVDLFPAGPGAPVFIFIHGGYWRALSHRHSAFMAPCFVEKGIAVVAVNYSLAPTASIDTIVHQCRNAVEWVWREGASEMDIDRDRIFVGGSSAGGHLTGMMLAGGWRAERALPEDLIKGGISFSGLHDLEPIRLSIFNETTRIDEEAAHRNSPIHHPPENTCPLIVTCGDLETSEFKRQSQIYAEAWRTQGGVCSHFVTPGRNHFDVVFEMCDPESQVSTEMFSMIGVQP
jgi:arylformamidase